MEGEVVADGRAVLEGGPADGRKVADPGEGKIRWFDGDDVQHVYRRQASVDGSGRSVFAYLGEASSNVTGDDDGVPEEPDHTPRPDTDPNITTTAGQASKPAKSTKPVKASK